MMLLMLMCARCNNLRNPYWGAANIGMRRYLEAEYQDSQNIPTGQSNYLPCVMLFIIQGDSQLLKH